MCGLPTTQTRRSWTPPRPKQRPQHTTHHPPANEPHRSTRRRDTPVPEHSPEPHGGNGADAMRFAEPIEGATPINTVAIPLGT